MVLRRALEDQATCRSRLAQGSFACVSSTNRHMLYFFLFFFELRHMGAFGDQFRDREWEYRCDKPRTDRWKEALSSVSCKAGLAFDKRSDESKFVRIILKEVEKELQLQVNPISVFSKAYMDIEHQNNYLRAQLLELSERLQSLNSIIEMSLNFR
ncbi:unnamed protein product [Brassica oleracea]